MAKIRKFAVFIVLAINFIHYSSTSFAQDNYYEEEKHTFLGGLVGGASFTQVDGDNFAGYNKVGINAGGIIYTQLADHIAVSLEILYTGKGSHSNLEKKSNSNTYLITKYDIDLHYAEVPLQLCYFDKRKSHFGAGFSYARLITYKETVETVPTLPPSVDLYKDYPFRKYDLNFVVGGNLHLVKGFFLNARFQYSLLPVRKNIYPEFGRPEQYNNMWIVRLMYLF